MSRPTYERGRSRNPRYQDSFDSGPHYDSHGIWESILSCTGYDGYRQNDRNDTRYDDNFYGRRTRSYSPRRSYSYDSYDSYDRKDRKDKKKSSKSKKKDKKDKKKKSRSKSRSRKKKDDKDDKESREKEDSSYKENDQDAAQVRDPPAPPSQPFMQPSTMRSLNINQVRDPPAPAPVPKINLSQPFMQASMRSLNVNNAVPTGMMQNPILNGSPQFRQTMNGSPTNMSFRRTMNVSPTNMSFRHERNGSPTNLSSRHLNVNGMPQPPMHQVYPMHTAANPGFAMDRQPQYQQQHMMPMQVNMADQSMYNEPIPNPHSRSVSPQARSMRPLNMMDNGGPQPYNEPIPNPHSRSVSPRRSLNMMDNGGPQPYSPSPPKRMHRSQQHRSVSPVRPPMNMGQSQRSMGGSSQQHRSVSPVRPPMNMGQSQRSMGRHQMGNSERSLLQKSVRVPAGGMDMSVMSDSVSNNVSMQRMRLAQYKSATDLSDGLTPILPSPMKGSAVPTMDHGDLMTDLMETKLPPGEAGLTLIKTIEGLTVHQIADNSIAKDIQVGDIIISLDGVDVSIQ